MLIYYYLVQPEEAEDAGASSMLTTMTADGDTHVASIPGTIKDEIQGIVSSFIKINCMDNTELDTHCLLKKIMHNIYIQSKLQNLKSLNPLVLIRTMMVKNQHHRQSKVHSTP